MSMCATMTSYAADPALSSVQVEIFCWKVVSGRGTTLTLISGF